MGGGGAFPHCRPTSCRCIAVVVSPSCRLRSSRDITSFGCAEESWSTARAFEKEKRNKITPVVAGAVWCLVVMVVGEWW